MATDAPWLTAVAVAMDSCRRFPKKSLKQHVADIKNIGDYQVTLRVDQNSSNIAQSFKIVVYEITNNASRLTAMLVPKDLRRRLPKRSIE